MKTVVIKRDGSQAPFNAQRIAEAILKASGAARCKGVDAFAIATEVENGLKGQIEVDINHIQDKVEQQLMTKGHLELARVYIEYRHDRDLARERKSHLNSEIYGLIEQSNASLLNENANKDGKVLPYPLLEIIKNVSGRVSELIITGFIPLMPVRLALIKTH